MKGPIVLWFTLWEWQWQPSASSALLEERCRMAGLQVDSQVLNVGKTENVCGWGCSPTSLSTAVPQAAPWGWWWWGVLELRSL